MLSEPHPTWQELYTGSNDRQILVWSPSIPAATEMVHLKSACTLLISSACCLYLE
jgi:hypothetical protein